MESHEFVKRFEEAWKEPQTRFVELFHPEGTLLQSGMEAPIGKEQIPQHQQITLTLLPDMKVEVDRWAANGDDVFIEWSSSGTFLGKGVRWSGASRFTLRDGLIIEECAYFDTLPLRALVNPSLNTGGAMTAAALAATQKGEA